MADDAQTTYLNQRIEYLEARIKNEKTFIRNMVICFVLSFVAGYCWGAPI